VFNETDAAFVDFALLGTWSSWAYSIICNCDGIDDSIDEWRKGSVEASFIGIGVVGTETTVLSQAILDTRSFCGLVLCGGTVAVCVS
jgi:hypothetical protein